MARQVQASRMGTRFRRRRASVKKRQPRTITRFSRALRGNNPNRITTFSGNGFPDTLRTRLNYSQSIILTPTALVPLQYKFYRMNGPYDPDQSVGGNQPYFYDQCAAIYSRYKVLGAKATFVFARTTATTGGIGPYIVGAVTGQETTLPTSDAGDLISHSNVNWDVLGDAGASPKTITVTYSPKQAFGGMLTDAVESATNTTPTQQWYAAPFISPQGTDATREVNVIVEIEYFIEFSQIIHNAGS